MAVRSTNAPLGCRLQSGEPEATSSRQGRDGSHIGTPIMPDSSRYPVPATRCRAELIIDRSRFICSLARAGAPDEAQAFLRDVQAELPGATHHCCAHVAGAPSPTIRIGMSDDGDPREQHPALRAAMANATQGSAIFLDDGLNDPSLQ